MAWFDKTINKLVGIGRGVLENKRVTAAIAFAGRNPRLTGSVVGGLAGGAVGAGVAGPGNRGKGFLGGAALGAGAGFYGMGQPKQLGLPGMGRETRFGDWYNTAAGYANTVMGKADLGGTDAIDRIKYGVNAFDWKGVRDWSNVSGKNFMRNGPAPEGFQALKGTQTSLLNMPTFGLGANLSRKITT